jgi:hypothetical protein
MAKWKKYKRTNNYLQSITQKTKDRATRTPLKTDRELRCSERESSSSSTCYTPRDKSWMGKRSGRCLRQVEHTHGHLWHIYSVTANTWSLACPIKKFCPMHMIKWLVRQWNGTHDIIIIFCIFRINVVSSNPTRAIQHYVIKFVTDLRQVGGFLRVLWFPPVIKLTATI